MGPLAAVVLALVLAVAAVAKGRDSDHVADAMTALRLPFVGLHRAAAIVLLAVEASLAVALLVATGYARLVACALTLALMTAYTVVIGRALAFSQPVTCACFGRLSTGTVSWHTLARNLCLVALAALCLLDSPRQATITPLTDGLWGPLLVVLLAVLVAGLTTQGGTASGARMHASPAPDAQGLAARPVTAPAALLELPGGREVVMTTLLGDRPGLFLRLSWTCEPCTRLLNALPAWAASVPAVGVYCVVPLHDPQCPPDLAYPLTPVFDRRGEFAATVPAATPSAVLVGADGLVAGGPVVGTDDIRQLLDEISDSVGGEPLGELSQCASCG